jgi:hypothetical protein
MSSPLPVEQLLLHKFINNLPTHSPSPFKTDIFVENPEQKRKLVERPVFLKERDQYDENEFLFAVSRWPWCTTNL